MATVVEHRQGFSCLFAHINPAHYSNPRLKGNCASVHGHPDLANLKSHTTGSHGHCPHCYEQCLDHNRKNVESIKRWAKWAVDHQRTCRPQPISDLVRKAHPEPLKDDQRLFWIAMSKVGFKKSEAWKTLENAHPLRPDEEADDWEWRLIFQHLHPRSQGYQDPRARYWIPKHEAQGYPGDNPALEHRMAQMKNNMQQQGDSAYESGGSGDATGEPASAVPNADFPRHEWLDQHVEPPPDLTWNRLGLGSASAQPFDTANFAPSLQLPDNAYPREIRDPGLLDLPTYEEEWPVEDIPWPI